MEISFDTVELRQICADEDVAAQALDPVAAEALKRRIADIRAADSIEDVPAGRPHRGVYQGEECFFFELGPSFRLTVVPAHTKPRLTPDGSADWGRIRRVKVVSLQP